VSAETVDLVGWLYVAGQVLICRVFNLRSLFQRTVTMDQATVAAGRTALEAFIHLDWITTVVDRSTSKREMSSWQRLDPLCRVGYRTRVLIEQSEAREQ
jgi:hypothetical protein